MLDTDSRLSEFQEDNGMGGALAAKRVQSPPADLVQIDGILKSFGPKIALKNVSFRSQPDRFVNGKKTGRLAPAVVLDMVYNAVVLS